MQILVVRIDLVAHKLGSLNQTVNSDGQILARDVDVASVKQRQHAMSLKVFQVLVIGHLHLVAEVYHMGEELLIVFLVVNRILDAAVEVYGEHTL